MGNRVYPRLTPRPRAVLGWDGTDFRVVLVDEAHRLQVDVVNLDDIGDIATQTTLAQCLTALQIIDGYVHASNTLFAYNDRLFFADGTSTAAADDNTYTSGAVPDGEMWVLLSMTTRNANTDATRQWMGVNIGSTDYWPHLATGVAVNESSEWSGHIELHKDDYIKFLMRDCTLNDDLSVLAFGYKMKV